MKNGSAWLGMFVAFGAGVALNAIKDNGLVLYLALLAIAERIHEKK